MKYSVIIPCYNAEHTIRMCLDSLTDQDFEESYEILVIDSSSDKTPEIIKNEYPTVKLIHLEKQTLPGKGRNIGIKESKGEILLFIDSDCIASKSWIRKMVEAHKNTKYNVVGGSVNNANPESLIGWASFLIEFTEFVAENTKQEVRNMPTCNISYTREIMEKHGSFPTDIWPSEERIYHWDITEKDPIIFTPSIKIFHHNRSSLKTFFAHQSRFGKSSALGRKRRPKLPGYFLINHPYLITLLPLKKLLTTWYRTFKLNKKMFFYYTILSPLLLLGNIVWSWTFFKVAINKNEN